MTKFYEEHIKWMKKFRKEGFTYAQIGEMMESHDSSIQYCLKEDYRKRNQDRAKQTSRGLTKEQTKKKNLKFKVYRKEYFHNRYHSDPEFRKQLINLNKKGYKKRKELRIKKGLCRVCGGIREDKKWKLCAKCRKKNMKRQNDRR